MGQARRCCRTRYLEIFIRHVLRQAAGPVRSLRDSVQRQLRHLSCSTSIRLAGMASTSIEAGNLTAGVYSNVEST